MTVTFLLIFYMFYEAMGGTPLQVDHTSRSQSKAAGDSNHGCALARHDAGFLPRRSRSLREDECYGHQHSTASNASMCAAALVRRNRVH